VIITTNNVLVMNPEDENVLPFITELKMKISQPSGLAGIPTGHQAGVTLAIGSCWPDEV
jgi:hypothetical protein